MKELQQHESASSLPYLGLTDEPVKLSNLSPDLVFFTDEIMDTLC